MIKAKDFSDRKQLEFGVRKLHWLTPDKKDDTIQGTREELARLGLSDRSAFYGINCVITDTPIKTEKQKPKVDRGQKFKSFIS